MDQTRGSRTERWQARQERVGEAQARYLALLAALSILYLGLLLTEPAASAGPPEGIDRLLPWLHAIGPLAIWLAILATYGTMRMATYGKLRLRALERYAPSRFLDFPNFLDAIVFTPPPPWGRALERWVVRYSYPLAATIPWVEGVVLLYLGFARSYFSPPWYVVAVIYLPPMAGSLRCVVRLWSGRLLGERRRDGGRPARGVPPGGERI